ncbi:unnamed protein product [Haemonchus placei]|uniref:Secreted protein n=1 Tax=Haemonchus placei TaxID=6290 RepID=A0A0N4WBZ8_HAEPC|nr:unnamed protein product [Haemonchus placei]
MLVAEDAVTLATFLFTLLLSQPHCSCQTFVYDLVGWILYALLRVAKAEEAGPGDMRLVGTGINVAMAETEASTTLVGRASLVLQRAEKVHPVVGCFLKNCLQHSPFQRTP